MLIVEEDKVESALLQRKLVKFPKAARLLQRRQFQKIAKEGHRIYGKSIYIQHLIRPHPVPPKLGITVSKKYGKAHDRNRFKRVVREAFREYAIHLPQGMEIHISPKKEQKTIKKHDIALDLLLVPLQ